MTDTAWVRGPLVVGHRGGRGEGWPRENTLAAFERARQEGAAAIELDVRSSGDGEVVVFHDETLSRATGGADARRVCDVSTSALADLEAPTLNDALLWARSRHVAVNVEIKHDVPSRTRLARRTVRVLRAVHADVLVSSFDPLLLAIVAALAPDVRRALLVHAGQPLWADLLQRVARPGLVQGIHLESAQASPPVVARHLALGLRVGVWTVNDAEEAAHLVDLGVASIITDKPGLVARRLGAQSQSTDSAGIPGGGA